MYIGIGSNIDAEINIDKALTLLQKTVGAMDVSPVYKNPAQGFMGDDFLNLVVGFEYAGELLDLCRVLDTVEQQCGRQRELETGKGSRTIDLDLLIFGELEGDYQGMKLPRSDVFNRQFVWQPLLDLFDKKDRLSDFEARIKERIPFDHQSVRISTMITV